MSAIESGMQNMDDSVNDLARRAQQLSVMQRHVTRLVALGCSVAEAAQMLEISENTAEKHKCRAMQRLGLHKLSLMTRAAIETGISPIGDKLSDEERGRLAASL
jgi:DNA-binding NarL/FixJ family response regulator